MSHRDTRSIAISIFLYLFGAALSLSIPEYSVSEADFHLRTYWNYIEPSFSVRLVVLWYLMTIPWLITAYRLKDKISWKMISVPIGLVCLAAAWVKPPHSPDIYQFAGYGRQIFLGINPYETTLINSHGDAVIQAVKTIARDWASMHCVYGPLSLVLMLGVNLIGPDDSLIGLGRVVKLTLLPGYALWAWVLWQHWEKHSYRTLLVLTVIANPVAIFLFCVEGHLDIYMLAFFTLAGLYLKRNEPIAAGVAFCASASIKLLPISTLPVIACYLWRRDRKRCLQFLGTFLVGYGLLQALAGGGEWRGVMALNQTWANLLWSGLLPRILLWFGVDNLETMGRAADICLYTTVAILCIAHLRGRFQGSPLLGAGLVLAVICLTRTHVRPWYNFWFWPLLWMSCSDKRYIVVSSALCTAATVFSLWHSYMVYVPYVNAIAITIDLSLLFLCRRQNLDNEARP